MIPWFGKELTGGAEQQAWHVAQRLAAGGHRVEVLTTCGRSFQSDWGANSYAPGTQRVGGVIVRRFPVDARNRDAFERVNTFLLSQPVGALKSGVSPIDADGSACFVEHNINSSALVEHLSGDGASYDAVIFIPYLYGTTLNGLKTVADRAYLQPCLHDEAYAYLPQVEDAFHAAKGLLFNSEGELQLAAGLYGPGIIEKSHVVGQWIERQDVHASNGVRFGSFAPQRERYVLYLGRRDQTKNVGLLVEAFTAFRRQNRQSALKLVLAGIGMTSWDNPGRNIVDLGFVTEAQKDALIEHCLALFQPSKNESFSRVVMEAWSRKKPVVVNANCLSTRLVVEQSGGGWTAGGKRQWAEVFADLDSAPQEDLTTAGGRGHDFYTANATWESVIHRYEIALERNGIPPSSRAPAVYHVLSESDLCDDLVRRALLFHRLSEKVGATSALVASLPADADADAVVVYHYRPGESGVGQTHPGRKTTVVVSLPAYDNIDADRAVSGLAGDRSLVLADTERTASAFKASNDVAVLPVAVDTALWDLSPDRYLAQRLNDGTMNFLFAGRICPDASCEALVASFAHLLSFEKRARLCIVGHFDEDDPYHTGLRELITSHGLANHVVLPGAVGASELSAYFRAAHVFWSMSHATDSLSCYIDAMWFDIPILAFGHDPLREMLGSAGILYSDRQEFQAVAALANILAKDQALRQKVLAAQRERRVAFRSDSLEPFVRRALQLERESVA